MSRLKPLLLLLFLFLACLPALASNAVVDWEFGFVNTRAEPSHGAKKNGVLQKGAKVEILSQKGDWAKVRHTGGEGWVVLKSLRVVADKAAPKPTVAEPAAAQPSIAPSQPAAAPSAPAAPVLPVAAPVMADTSATPQPSGGYLSGVTDRPALPEVSIWKTIFSMLTGLLLVLGIIGGIVWGLRRFFGKNFPGLQGGTAIRLLASKPLGQRQALMLVEIGGEIYLISQTDSEIRLLTKIETPSAIDRLDYLFTFKPSKFESELRRELDVESREEEEKAVRDGLGAEVSPSIAERLARLRGKHNPTEKS